MADRNANTTTITHTGTTPTTVTSSKGADGARKASLTYDPDTGLLNGVFQTSAGTTRSAGLRTDGYSSNLFQVTDRAGKNTTFTYLLAMQVQPPQAVLETESAEGHE